MGRLVGTKTEDLGCEVKGYCLAVGPAWEERGAGAGPEAPRREKPCVVLDGQGVVTRQWYVLHLLHGYGGRSRVSYWLPAAEV